jgi:outer membrane lipoprotein SlyB
MNTNFPGRILAALGTVALAFASALAFAQAKAPGPGTYGYLTGNDNYKPVVTLSKTAKKSCKTCGAITDIKLVQDKAKGSGLGAIAGAVGGGLLGHQVGSGRGKTLATIAGVAGGALAGNEIERRVKDGEKHWDVNVTMDDKKTTHQIRFADEPKFATGDRVNLSYAK